MLRRRRGTALLLLPPSSWFEDGFGWGLLLVNAAILVGGAYSVATTVLALPPVCFP
jgi:hypothetical protein